MDCVEPGLQSRNTSVNVTVPVHESKDGAKIYWIDSDQTISKDEKVKFSISGSINFCPSQGEKKVLVPASFCDDGSEPRYAKAKNINAVQDNYGIDKNEMCGGQEFGSNRRYVDAEVKVNPGDKLSFNLVAREVEINYSDPEGKGISFDDNCYKAEGGNEKATAKDIIEGGTFWCKDKDGKRNEVKFPSLSEQEMKTNRVLVGNGYTPYDNKVHFNKDYIKDDVPWINGALSDLRRTKVGLNELCDGKRCSSGEVKKYSSYELNCYYQNICYNKEGTGDNCVSSIRYKKYDNNNTCDMYSHLKEMQEAHERGDYSVKTIDDAWAEALVAKIGNLDAQYTAKGNQCLPNSGGARNDNTCSRTNGDFKDFSLQLSREYKVNENIQPGSNVMLGIAYNGNASGFKRGGYHVKVKRSCEHTDGNKLYVYLGDKPPKDLSTIGSNNFNRVSVLNKIKEDDIDYYTIDGNKLNEEGPKKIYFGIDVSNVNISDITDKNGKYYENNKYTITLFVKKKINDFISSSINKLFDFIREGGDDNVKTSYEGYRKGLLQGVRALLTLYVIFSVVGYMMRTIQLSKFDFIVRMMKIAFIAFVFSEKSWELFGMTLSGLFVNGSTYLVDSFSGYIASDGRKFAFLDLTAGVLFTSETWLKFLSLMLSGPFGFIAFLMILRATFAFLRCIISATFKYVISTVLVAFLLSLTPLFIVFMLFQQTKSLFDGWIKTLAHIAIAPVILFSSLSLLNQLMYLVLYNLTNFSACYQCLISVNFLSYDLCLMKSILPLGYNPGTTVDVALSSGERSGGHFAALPIDLIQAFIYLIIASAMEVFVHASEVMAQSIFRSGYGVTGSVRQVAHNASQAILSTVGLDNETQEQIKAIKRSPAKDRAKIDIQDSKSSDGTDPQSNKSNTKKQPGNKGGEKTGKSGVQEEVARRGSTSSSDSGRSNVNSRETGNGGTGNGEEN